MQCHSSTNGNDIMEIIGYDTCKDLMEGEERIGLERKLSPLERKQRFR